jgi:hypothetical protein
MIGYAGQGSGGARPAIPGVDQANPAVSNGQGAGAAQTAQPAASGAPTAAGRDQPRTAQQIRDQLRNDIRQSVQNGGTPQIIVPNDFTNVVPRGAVEISIAFFVTVAAIIIFTPLARALARRSDAQSRALEEAGRQVSPQIRQLQESVDAMALEIERISEAQRFQTRLLAGKEREGAPADR